MYSAVYIVQPASPPPAHPASPPSLHTAPPPPVHPAPPQEAEEAVSVDSGEGPGGLPQALPLLPGQVLGGGEGRREGDRGILPCCWHYRLEKDANFGSLMGMELGKQVRGYLSFSLYDKNSRANRPSTLPKFPEHKQVISHLDYQIYGKYICKN